MVVSRLDGWNDDGMNVGFCVRITAEIQISV